MRLGALWPETLIEGPAGTGKSYGVAHYVDALCVLFPGCRGLIVRKTLKSLRESVQVTLEQKVWGEQHPCVTASTATRAHRQGYVYPEATNVVNGVVYSGRSEIVLGGMDNPGRVLSTEFDWVWAEEAFEISLEAWETLGSRNRNWVMPWQQMIATTNPESQYHWLNARPEERGDDGRPKMRRLKSRHWENPLFWDLERNRWKPAGEQYVAKRLANASHNQRRRYYLGEWFASSGRIWDSYDENIHVVPLDAVPEPKWAIGGLDWGFRNPGALTVWVVDKEDRIYCVREAYHTGQSLDWWAGMVQRANAYLRERWKLEMSYVVADSAEPRSIETLNALLRKPLYEGGGYVRPTRRKDQMAQILIVDRAMRPDLELNGGKPSWHIADDTLMHPADPKLVAEHRPTCLKHEVPAWVWRKTEDGRPIKDEEDPTCDAHAIDSAKYVGDEVFERDLSGPKAPQTFGPGSFGAVLGDDEIDLHDD